MRAQLESLFVVQPTKTEEMEDASRGYGLLLHAFGLRTKEMRDQYSAQFKAKVGLKLSMISACGKVIAVVHVQFVFSWPKFSPFADA